MKGSHKVSVLQGTEKECYITGRTDNLEKHHCYYGVKGRAISDKYGFWVWLIPEYHRGTSGVHGKNGHELDMELKQACQMAYEETGHTRQEFIQLIGKNYL